MCLKCLGDARCVFHDRDTNPVTVRAIGLGTRVRPIDLSRVTPHRIGRFHGLAGQHGVLIPCVSFFAGCINLREGVSSIE